MHCHRNPYHLFNSQISMLSTGVACSLIPWDLLLNVTQQWIQKFTKRYLALTSSIQYRRKDLRFLILTPERITCHLWGDAFMILLYKPRVQSYLHNMKFPSLWNYLSFYSLEDKCRGGFLLHLLFGANLKTKLGVWIHQRIKIIPSEKYNESFSQNLNW